MTLQSARIIFVSILMLLIAAACVNEPPQEYEIKGRGEAYQRQIVAVDGDTAWAWVVFDPGDPTEVRLRTGLFATNYFQVPADAEPGSHETLLRNSEGDSANESLLVRELPTDWPAPRIEDIGLFWSAPATDGTANDLLLTVSVANLDVEADVRVDGVLSGDLPTWGALPVEYQLDRNPSTFGYPIFHYLQLLVTAEDVQPGDVVTIEVINVDGKSDTQAWTVPTSDQLDSDGDGLLDAYDGGIYTAPGGATIDLEAMGTSKYRKDILVEVDWITAATPQAGNWEALEEAFAAAPVLNPDGSAGINLILDRGQGEPFTGGGTIVTNHATIDFGTPQNPPPNYVDFYTIKGNPQFFDPDRLRIFHYLVFGRARPTGSSGRGEIIGNDAIVSFVNFREWGGVQAEAGTAMHELGHNLGLRHGGHEDTASQPNERYKPNLPSLMNYKFQFGGVDTTCDLVSDAVLGYSSGQMADRSEPVAVEVAGICDNIAIDFNGDGDTNDGPPLNLNPDRGRDSDQTDLHRDANQWGNLRLAFLTDPDTRWNND